MFDKHELILTRKTSAIETKSRKNCVFDVEFIGSKDKIRIPYEVWHPIREVVAAVALPKNLVAPTVAVAEVEEERLNLRAVAGEDFHSEVRRFGIGNQAAGR